MRTDVVALYVDPRGPYPSLVSEWYDEARDARTYEGPLPIVAHPPCGPWGRLKHLSRKDDPSLAMRAVEQVRAFGGILEHPAHSLLWDAANMARPGELPDAGGNDGRGDPALRARLRPRGSCSCLYAACWRAARALGYRRLITYTLPEEGGASLRGAGWKLVGEAGGGSWDRKDRPRVDELRWEAAGA